MPKHHIVVLEAYYVGIVFSDHFAFIVKIQLPVNMEKLVSPKSCSLFKSKPEVIQNKTFHTRLEQNFLLWQDVKTKTGIGILDWWEIVVKPNIKKLLIERGREISKQKTGELNLLLIRQAYLVRKLQLGMFEYLAELNCVQAESVRWHRNECEKVKFPHVTIFEFF